MTTLQEMYSKCTQNLPKIYKNILKIYSKYTQNILKIKLKIYSKYTKNTYTLHIVL